MAYTKIKIRGDISTNWNSNNPILADREVGLETDTKKFKVGNGTDNYKTLSYYNEYVLPTSVTDDISNNTKELTRLKTLINDEVNDVFSYRGSNAPTLPAAKKAYYLSFYSLESSQILNLTAGLAVGTVVVIDNTDGANALKIAPQNGELINGNAVLSLNVAANSMIFLVKIADGWQIAYQGLVLKDLKTLTDTIKANIPPTGTALTMDQIQAALKDRLHTFAEIQKEFADQLHTLAAIQADTNTAFADKLHTLLEIKGYIEIQLNDKLHTFDEIDAHIGNVVTRKDSVDVTTDLTMDSTTYDNYKGRIISLSEATGDTYQIVRLPQISKISDYPVFVFYNNRGVGEAVDIYPHAGDMINEKPAIRLGDHESATIQRLDDTWIITAINRESTISNILNGGKA